MKKLSAIIALAVCLTIGGVYATWHYAGTNDIADAFAEAKITITDAEFDGANGVYHIESNLVLEVDQANDDHETVLNFLANNGEAIYLKITFTPADYAPQTIKDEGVPTEFYFTTTTEMEYKMDAEGNYDENGTATPILTFSNPSDGVFSPNVTWVKQDNVFVAEYDEAALRAMISLSQTFVLDTKAEHDAFMAALSGNIRARVTDGVAIGQ